ncbi:MAG TPA: bacteriohopanetetrol glucosamine biosynthesis glycosyltransferase HpnI [Clostridia bacterium]|nr:bacteriohopanetetrol glucosamine biosynthesis glycosyltransferase HpnI [Clostridia bacterium]
MTLAQIATVANLWRVLLAVAVVGTISSTVYLLMVIAAALRYRRIASAAQAALDAIPRTEYPRVAVLKPVHGLEPRMEENLESFFLQNYPDFEIIFGTRSAEDPALKIVEKLRRRYPNIPVSIVFSGHPTWPNAKVFSLDRMISECRKDYFVISDSDILVKPEFLRSVVTPLLDRRNGLVTCLYEGVPAPDFWSRLEALGMSVELPSGVMIADMMEGMKFALGAVMVVRRDALNKIGGIKNTADYYSDDFVLGNLVEAAGFNVVLSHHQVGHVLTAQSLRQTFATQLRWMQSTRYSRPKGHFGTGLTFATPFGVLGLIVAGALGWWPLGIGLCAWSYLNRVIQAMAVGSGVIGDKRARLGSLVYPLRDFLGFFLWAGSYIGGSRFVWRGESYRFTNGGRIVPERKSAEAARA